MEYLNIAGRQPLLTADEEIILGRAVQAMQGLPSGPLDRQQRGIKRHGMKARERMVAANMRLVMAVAKKFHRQARHLQLEDLLQEGTIGLVRAVEKFDPERGYKFSTYAFWWIRQSMARAIATYDRSIRLPQHQHERLIKLKAWLSKQSELGQRPTLDECAAFLGTDCENVRDLLSHAQDASSLDTHVRGHDSDSSTLIDLIADDRDLPWDVVASDYSDEMQVLKAVIPQLPERHQEFLQLRLSPDFFSRSQLAQQLGISRERARQLENACIHQIKVRLRIA
jgi:RNA polymerase sigma factor (sigma-70 family)